MSRNVTRIARVSAFASTGPADAEGLKSEGVLGADATNTLSSPLWNFVDVNSTNFSRRFYRAVCSPH